jgi:hypothetical protein
MIQSLFVKKERMAVFEFYHCDYNPKHPLDDCFERCNSYP